MPNVASQLGFRSDRCLGAVRRLSVGVAQGQDRRVGGYRCAHRRRALHRSRVPRHLLAGRLGQRRSSVRHCRGAHRVPVQRRVHPGLPCGGPRPSRGGDWSPPGSWRSAPGHPPPRWIR